MNGNVKKDLSYLKAFSSKTLREVRRILCKGFTVEDLDEFLGKREWPKPSRRIPKEARKQFFSEVKWGRRKP